MGLNNNNNDNKYCENVFLQFYHLSHFHKQTFLITPTFLPQFSFGVVRIEIGNKLKVEIGFFKCM